MHCTLYYQAEHPIRTIQLLFSLIRIFKLPCFRSKHNLSPSTNSSISCGVAKAVEALHGDLGVIILISRGGQSFISRMCVLAMLEARRISEAWLTSINWWSTSWSCHSWVNSCSSCKVVRQLWQLKPVENSSWSTPPPPSCPCTDNISTSLTPSSGASFKAVVSRT